MTLTLMSNLRCVLVTRSGASAAISRTRRPRYASGSFSLKVILPSPGWMRTRAIAFLRRPVPRLKISAKLDVPSRIECDDLRLLRHVAVVGTGVDAKSLQHVGAQGVPLQHPADGVGHRKRWVQILRALQRALAQAARVPGVPRVFLARELGAADLDLGGVDDDDMVAGVQVRGERGLVLAAQDLGHAARQAAEHLVRGIDHKPIALQVRGFRRPRFLLAHLFKSLSKSLPSKSGPRRGLFSAPSAGLWPAAPPPPIAEACALCPPPPPPPRCRAQGPGRILRPPAPARRSPLAVPPSQRASRAPVSTPARRPSSSSSSRACRQAAAPPSTSH